jgi:hypothetical protein
MLISIIANMNLKMGLNKGIPSFHMKFWKPLNQGEAEQTKHTELSNVVTKLEQSPFWALMIRNHFVNIRDICSNPSAWL